MDRYRFADRGLETTALTDSPSHMSLYTKVTTINGAEVGVLTPRYYVIKIIKNKMMIKELVVVNSNAVTYGDEAHFWLNGYVNKQNCRIWSEANPQVYVETPLHPEKLTVWCALWAGGILLQKR
ncbi:hypothetical protein TNCV_1970931 [Trichonephila clavipes]|uniref:Uncharacterized protein n=1 Tax=Trichonephila clavipes TaxID=2585209 RepID=A0A8X6W5P9_TRICX|nr:hypothetical protein TNCV_1970931 [Trichonephila clavipes]